MNLLAQAAEGADATGHMMEQLISVAVFAGVGVAIFGVAFFAMAQLSPFSLRKEIEEDQNTSLGIVMGSVILGISIIIAAAIVG